MRKLLVVVMLGTLVLVMVGDRTVAAQAPAITAEQLAAATISAEDLGAGWSVQEDSLTSDGSLIRSLQRTSPSFEFATVGMFRFSVSPTVAADSLIASLRRGDTFRGVTFTPLPASDRYGSGTAIYSVAGLVSGQLVRGSIIAWREAPIVVVFVFISTANESSTDLVARIFSYTDRQRDKLRTVVGASVIAAPVVAIQPSPPTSAEEVVALFTGCNNVTLTWPNGTPTTTVAESVTPAGILVAAWRFENAAGRFIGFSPEFPAVSDLQAVTRLDAVFLCVNAAGSMSRPALVAAPAPAASVAPAPAPATIAPPPAIASAAPIVLEGRGQFASQSITLPRPASVVTFTHNGTSNFIVKSFVGGKEDLLVNTIGRYQGSRPLVANQPVTIDIRADGAWTLRIEPIATGGSPAFSGNGDAVSRFFDPPSSGAWEISHDGQRNFIVWARCAGGDTLVQNQIGATAASRVVSFRLGPCFWDVRGDGNWSLTPR